MKWEIFKVHLDLPVPSSQGHSRALFGAPQKQVFVCVCVCFLEATLEYTTLTHFIVEETCSELGH